MPLKRRVTETEALNDSIDVHSDRPQIQVHPTQPGPVKRQRVSRACDQCRAARERCDGKQPQCYPCISQKRPCTYEVSPKKRGVQTGYIRTLELALGWVFEKVPGSEHTLTTLLAHERGQGRLILTGKDPGEADRLQKRWRESRAHGVIERILSGEPVPSPSHDDISPPTVENDIGGDAAQGDINPEPTLPGLGTGAQRNPNVRSSSSVHCSPFTPSDEPRGSGQPGRSPLEDMSHSSQAAPRRLKLPAEHWRLLDIYFSYTHSWLPILEKQALFQASYLYPDHGLLIDPLDASSAVHAELWAALALASFQDAAGMKQQLSNGRTISNDHSPSDIYNTARELLPAEHGPFHVHHARALLLLSLVNMGQGKLTGAGMLNGSAIHILFDQDTTRGGVQANDRLRTNIIWMACFLVDTILSIRCRKPPHLRPGYLDTLPLASESGPDQWEPWTACDGFGFSSTADSRSSRSPAFCSSTFNMVYSIVQAVAREVSTEIQGSLPENLGRLLTQLQQAVGPSAPFGNFVISQTCGTVPVPTPYVVRAIYLWACALAEPLSEMHLPSLKDTLGNFRRQFGSHGTPPIIPIIIASLANEEFLLRCSEKNRRRVEVLVSSYCAQQYGDMNPSGVRSSYSSSLQQARGRPGPLVQASVPHNSTIHFPTPNMPPLYHQPTGTQRHEAHEANSGHDPVLTPAMTGTYRNPFTDSMEMTRGNDGRMRHSGIGVPAMPGFDTTMPAIHRSHPLSNAFISPSGFGASPDFDALLDDLASIENADPVDLDAQFMTNLGFAPGCDITEILTRGFGGA